VVENEQYGALQRERAFHVYLPYWRDPSLDDARIAARTRGDGALLKMIARGLIKAQDHAVPLTELELMSDRLALLAAPTRVAGHVIGLSAILFMIGVIGVVTRRNVIVVLMSIELMLNAANVAFVGFNRLWPGTAGAPGLDGQVFVLTVITVAAAEVAVGLGIVISMFRNRDSVNLEDVSLLKW